MSPLMPVVAVLLVTAPLPQSTSLQLPTGETVEMSADSVLYEPEHQRLIARGHARVSKGALVLRADEVVYDQVHRRALARGNIMLVEGQMAAVADELGMRRILVPPRPGAFSALGLLCTDVVHDYIRSELRPLAEVTAEGRTLP